MNDNFNPKDPDTWPFWLTLSEVASILRYKCMDSVRALTNKPVPLGGLGYRKEGRRRMVSKTDMLAYLNRPATNAAIETPVQRPVRRKPAPVNGGFLAIPRKRAA